MMTTGMVVVVVDMEEEVVEADIEEIEGVAEVEDMTIEEVEVVEDGI